MSYATFGVLEGIWEPMRATQQDLDNARVLFASLLGSEADPLSASCPALGWLRGRSCIIGLRNESEREGVQAMTLPGRGRAIWENVAEMTIATGATDLGPDHAMAHVADSSDMFCIKRARETGPSGSRFEFVGGAKEWELA